MDHNLNRVILEKLFNNYCLLNWAAKRYTMQIMNYENRPFWQYCIITANKQNDKLDFLKNKVFMYNNAIWDKFFPPNYSCCNGYVRPLDMKELKEFGLTVWEINKFEHPFPEWAFNPGESDINQFIKRMIKKSLRMKKLK